MIAALATVCSSVVKSFGALAIPAQAVGTAGFEPAHRAQVCRRGLLL
jgi:hypothetical protein